MPVDQTAGAVLNPPCDRSYVPAGGRRLSPQAVPTVVRPSVIARRTKRLRYYASLVAVLWLGVGCRVVAQADAEGSMAAAIDVSLDGATYIVNASARLAADRRVVWDTLTDYERLREFVPGVMRARVLERTGDRLVIEQVGVFSVLFMDLPVRLRLVVEHTPYTMVLARLADPADVGDPTLRSFLGRYRLLPISLSRREGVRLDYDAQFELARPLPTVIGSLLGVAAVRRTMREQFTAMLREIERRQALVDAGD